VGETRLGVPSAAPYTGPVTRPLIAIPGYRVKAGKVHGWEQAALASPEPYILAVDRAGGLPVVVAPLTSDHVAEVLDRVDGLLLIGGGDMDPARYGEERHPKTYGVDTIRDEAEFALLRGALDRSLPTFAICRGSQVVNVAFGGTLIQHLEGAGLVDHGVPGLDGRPAMHDVKVEPGSTLADIGREVMTCCSHHHQAIDRIGEGLHAVAWADDGVVEAVEKDDGWLLAVQWHPEETAEEDRAQQALFDAFVARARGR
jgi:putative glutamine amidotransferase